MNEKGIQGLLNASPDKRYKSFLTRTADSAEVWVINSPDGYATYDIDDEWCLMLWPTEEFCKLFVDENERAEAIEIHDFLDRCKTVEENVRFLVFPNDRDGCIVTAEQLIYDMMEYLEQVE